MTGFQSSFICSLVKIQSRTFEALFALINKCFMSYSGSAQHRTRELWVHAKQHEWLFSCTCKNQVYFLKFILSTLHYLIHTFLVLHFHLLSNACEYCTKLIVQICFQQLCSLFHITKILNETCLRQLYQKQLD